MTVRLTRDKYLDLCAIVGRALLQNDLTVQQIGTLCECDVGIYLLGHRDPVTNHLLVDYVGSAKRTASDVANRINAHLLVEAKRERFTSQVVLPLISETPIAEVRRLEGIVARSLNVPRWCQRVPGGQSSTAGRRSRRQQYPASCRRRI